ncbi:cytidylate kinase family protein [Porphyromonadaceae bacterium OttesenSCG-928-L07]|nr:cytidylate kinase family protein [Porphyromonadaceae bacterium OttesenSCG-928-L07]MDL2251850.1 cytidylate kinase family protein [Odoribacter sp. OttesenSCG-928-J03]MDL2330539.1 cytidylate kinase family protein [Odoribacter sp. OttesenSCG-928-A06]
MKQDSVHIYLLRRCITFVLSLFVISLGSALTLRASLGSSPISVVPYIWSMASNIEVQFWGISFAIPRGTVGTYTHCMNILLLLLQVVLLRRQFKAKLLLQLIAGTLFGVFMDISMWLTAFFQWGDAPFEYIIRFAQVLVGVAVLAYGVMCEVKSDILVLPAEGFTIALAKVTGKDFAKAKILTDSSFVGIGVLFCFLFFGSWQWNLIGLATLVSMVFVGVMVRVYSVRSTQLEQWLFPPKKTEYSSPEVAVNTTLPLVVTIAREYGSGGHEIGWKLAERLDMEFYDQRLIDLAAKELGIDSETISSSEQRISTTKLLELIIGDKQIPADMDPSKEDSIFVEQSRIIRRVVAQKPCVIIGRCADYILKDRPNCFNVFIMSDLEFARQRVMEEFGLSAEKAEQKIHQVNQGRSNHYWQYTGRKWRDPEHYDLLINTSKIDIERAVELIASAVK